jgi:hypothetical protein
MQLMDLVVCEDIRFEMGGKLSVMGILDETLALPPMRDNPGQPMPFKIALLLRLLRDLKAPTPDSFKLKIEQDFNTLFKTEGSLKIEGQSRLMRFVFQPIVLQGVQQGRVSVDFQLLAGGKPLFELSKLGYGINIAVQPPPQAPAT